MQRDVAERRNAAEHVEELRCGAGGEQTFADHSVQLAGGGEERREEASVLNEAAQELHVALVQLYASRDASRRTQVLLSIEREGKPALLRVEQPLRVRVDRPLQAQIRPLHAFVTAPHAFLPHLLRVVVLSRPAALPVLPAALPEAAVVVEERPAAVRQTHLQLAAVHVSLRVVERADAAEVQSVVHGDRGGEKSDEFRGAERVELLLAGLSGEGEHVVDEVEVGGQLAPLVLHEEAAEAVFGEKRDDLLDVFEALDGRLDRSIQPEEG